MMNGNGFANCLWYAITVSHYVSGLPFKQVIISLIFPWLLYVKGTCDISLFMTRKGFKYDYLIISLVDFLLGKSHFLKLV